MKDLTTEEQIALDDIIHEVMAQKASAICNEGVSGQVEFLKADGYTETEIMAWITANISLGEDD